MSSHRKKHRDKHTATKTQTNNTTMDAAESPSVRKKLTRPQSSSPSQRRLRTTSPRKTAVAFRNRVPGGFRGGGSNLDQGYTEPSRTDADEPPLLDDDEEADFWFNKICQRDSLAQPNAPPSVEQVFDHQFSPESEKVDSCMPSQFAASEDFGTWETEATDDPDADDVFPDGPKLYGVQDARFTINSSKG